MFVIIKFAAQMQPQPQPHFCKIHAGNLNQYVSEYNMFNGSAPTPYRPFRINYRAYNVTEELIAKPLFYFALSDGNINAAFQLKGELGNNVIKDSDIIVQYIKYYSSKASFEIVGFCVNGTFASVPKPEVYYCIKLPLKTQLALQEAGSNVCAEQIVRLFH